MSSSYAADLELARQCAAGDEQAWERFVLEYRPILYRAADALDPSGGARDLADALYADLYSKSLFRYFQGRSSLATWLRAVLSQRYVDRIRANRRLEPLPDEERGIERADVHHYESPRDPTPDPDRARHLRLLQDALNDAVTTLNPKDRLRLGCYYAQGLTLARDWPHPARTRSDGVATPRPNPEGDSRRGRAPAARRGRFERRADFGVLRRGV